MTSDHFYFTLIILLLSFSIVCQIIIGILYQNMIRETENMTTTENKVLKACKTKFAACYQTNHGVANISIFVDKFLSRIKIGRFTMNGLIHFAGQTVLLSALVAGIGIYRAIVQNRSIIDLLPYYIISFLGLYAYFAVSAIINIPEKKESLKTNLVDYLENTLSARLLRTVEEEPETVPRGRKRELEIVSFAQKEKSKTTGKTIDAQELNALLMEYL